MVGKRGRGKHAQPCHFPDLPLVDWKWYLPSVNLPPSTCLARTPHTCSASARTHWSIWQLTYCLVPGRMGNAGHLGSVFKWCDSSCEKPREWQALTALTSGKEERGEQKGDVFIYLAAMTWLLYKNTLHIAFPHREHQQQKGNPDSLKLLANCSRQNWAPWTCPFYTPRTCDYVALHGKKELSIRYT